MLLTTWGQGLGEAPTSRAHYTRPLRLNDSTLHHPLFTDVHEDQLGPNVLKTGITKQSKILHFITESEPESYAAKVIQAFLAESKLLNWTKKFLQSHKRVDTKSL